MFWKTDSVFYHVYNGFALDNEYWRIESQTSACMKHLVPEHKIIRNEHNQIQKPRSYCKTKPSNVMV